MTSQNAGFQLQPQSQALHPPVLKAQPSAIPTPRVLATLTHNGLSDLLVLIKSLQLDIICILARNTTETTCQF